MNRLGMSVVIASSLVAGCVANDDQIDPTETSTSSQDSIIPILTCIPAPGGLCPITWTSDITAPGAYWAGHGTTNPAKVMGIFYFPTKADPTTGLATAYYAWMMAGYEPTCTTLSATVVCTPNNNAWRIYEVSASQISVFQAAARFNFNLHENQNPVGGIWDGGTGAGNGGSPGHPIGPGGVDPTIVQQVEANFGAFRSLTVNTYLTMNGTARTATTLAR